MLLSLLPLKELEIPVLLPRFHLGFISLITTVLVQPYYSIFRQDRSWNKNTACYLPSTELQEDKVELEKLNFAVVNGKKHAS